MRFDFKRLRDLVIWLAAKANVSYNDVLIVYSEPYVRLIAHDGDIEHCLQILGEQISYHIKQYVEI